jgi:hypothetical protein
MYLKKVAPKRVVIQGGVSQKAAYAWVHYLNEVLRLDPEFLSELLQTRVKCGAAIAMHQTVQVINLNQMDEILEPEPASPVLMDLTDESKGNMETYPVYSTSAVKDLDHMLKPRWVAGVLGLINGFIGISEHGKGPIDCVVDLETKLIVEFTVSDPYKKRNV